MLRRTVVVGSIEQAATDTLLKEAIFCFFNCNFSWFNSIFFIMAFFD